MRIASDELIRKHDYIYIFYNNEKGQKQEITGNLRELKPFIHEESSEELDYIVYGVTFLNTRKILTLRAPYCINNVTGFDYRLKL